MIEPIIVTQHSDGTEHIYIPVAIDDEVINEAVARLLGEHEDANIMNQNWPKAKESWKGYP